jgi:predicted hotdog family 3-hydroxylacyl-ACP dehydratase
MNFEDIDIHELLPQHEPFVMVGKLLHYDKDKTVTSTMIQSTNIFVENGLFTASGVIENIAQTCATRIGYINKYILKKDIQLGFIGAIRNLNIHRMPKVGETIETSILTLEEVFGMTLVSALVKSGDEIIAESEMKIAISEIKSQSVSSNGK